MRRETLDLIGSGLLLAALVTATFAVLAPTPGASTALSSAPSAVTVASTAHERGLGLFYAKGCATCHAKAGVERQAAFDVGPDLTGLAERAGTRRPGLTAEAYVREALRTPTAFIVPGFEQRSAMPDLGLSDAEIDAMTAFLLDQPR